MWKKWLTMSNMCKPVIPGHPFAEVLKSEGSSKREPQSCLFFPKDIKGEFTRVKKVQVPRP